MKQHYFSIGAAMLAILIAAIFLLTLPTSAARPTSTLSQPTLTVFSSPPPADYLIALPVPPLDPAEIPPNLTPERAIAYAHSLTYRQAQPILAELKRLRAEGSIAGFEVRPDLHGVVMTGARARALEDLDRLQEAAAIVPYADEPPACAAAAAAALPEQILGLSRMATATASGLRTAGLASRSTDPSIDAYVPPGSTGSTWTDVRGWTTPNTAVTLHILRGGLIIATRSTTSDSSGYYYFRPSWQQCPTSGYNWGLRPGDVVKVTAHGNTVSTVVAYLRSWVDPDEDTVAGRTDSGRSIEAHVCYPVGNDPCHWVWSCQSQTVSTSPDGNFTADFTSQVNLDRRAYATVYARDANGNSTYAHFYPYSIIAYFNDNNSWGYLKLGGDLAMLSRAGNVVSSYSGKSDTNSYYSRWFPEITQPSSVTSISGGGGGGLARGDFWGYLKPEVDFVATLSRTGSIVSTYSSREVHPKSCTDLACGYCDTLD